MAKRFTPVIGLAVVVALAMVAVFGAMSLTNPAQANIDSGPTAWAVVSDDASTADVNESITLGKADDGTKIDDPDNPGTEITVYKFDPDTPNYDNFAGKMDVCHTSLILKSMGRMQLLTAF